MRHPHRGSSKSGPRALALVPGAATGNAWPTPPPRRLAMADFAVGDGAFAQWTAPDFEKGLVARVIEVAWEDPPGTYLFDYDRVFHSMVLWEPITATIFLLTSFLFLWLSSQTVQAIVVAPLQKMLAALTTTASVIGPDGRISSESPSAAPMDIGEAVRRFLMLATYATKHRSVINKLSEKGDSDGDKGAEAPGGALKGTRGSSASRLLPLDVTPSLAGSIRGTSSRDMSVTAEGADARMKFGTVVLNGVGVRGWSPAVLLGDELVQAVHLIWIKMRVPDKVCSRKAFVAWAHELFKRHPTMRFHCTW